MFSISDTISAICTARGAGSIAVIRLSGTNSWNIIKKIFFSLDKNNDLHHMHAKHGYILDGEKKIDEVVILPYKSPKSFTSEDTIEIFTHGGELIPSIVLELCLKNGGRLAKNGEFTFRAFINGKIDLTKAEAINDLIGAMNPRAVEMASGNLSGRLKERVDHFRNELLNLITRIESHIEFPLDVNDTNKTESIKILENISVELNDLILFSKEGRILREGFKVSLIGAPNAGKSSLLNQLLESDRAIVTSTPGTTRDIIEEKIVLDGYHVILSDTAGIRSGENIDEAERLGIERSKESINNSDLVLAIIDITQEKEKYLNRFLDILEKKNKILIGNKCDLIKHPSASNYDILISAKTGMNIDLLKGLILSRLKDFYKKSSLDSTKPFYINERQKDLLIQCQESVIFAQEIIQKNDPEDLVADELKKALGKLDEISGAKINEEIIKNIFEKFCIGK